MKIIKSTLMLLLCLGQSMAYANEAMSDSGSPNQQIIANLLVENPWAKSTIPGVKVSAGYLKLTNNSDQTMRFTSVKSSAAKFTEFHTMTMSGSKMVMRKVDAIEIEPHQSFTFKEKSYHIMFMGINQPFKSGQSVTVTLYQDNGHTYDVVLPIKAPKSH